MSNETKSLEGLAQPVAWANRRHIETRCRIEAFTDEEIAKCAGYGEMAPLYSQEYVNVLQKRISELESQLQSGFTPEALAQEERAENAEQRIAELEGGFAFIMGQNDEMEKELRAKDARIEKLEQEPTIIHMRSVEESLIIASDQVAAAEKRIAELEEAEQKLWAANVSLDARAEFAERENAELKEKLATPVRLPAAAFLSVFYQCPRVISVDAASAAIREAGFKVEGDA